MQDESNPYRAPESRIAAVPLASDPAEQTCWRHGEILVVLRDAPLPVRCVKCNADAADGVRPHRFRWITPWAYAPLLAVPASVLMMAYAPAAYSVRLLGAGLAFGFLASLIANLRLRRSARHAVALCERHRRQIVRWRWCRAALFVAGALSPLLLSALAPMFLLCGLAIVLPAFGGRVLSPVRIDARYSRFVGCGDEFLRALPMLPEYRLHYLRCRHSR